MHDALVYRLARRLGSTDDYPDWYVVRRLIRRACAARFQTAMQQPIPRLLRDPGCVLRVTLSTMPELRLFPSAAAQQQTLQELGRSMRDVRDWRYWLMLALIAATAAASGLLVGQLAAWSLGYIAAGSVNYAVRLGTMLAMFWMLINRTQRLGAATRLRLRLIELGVPVCLKCGYALVGHTARAERCSECGRVIDAHVAELLAEQSPIKSQDDEHKDDAWYDRAA